MLTSELRWVRGFAISADPVDLRVLDILAGTFSQGIAREIVKRFGCELADHTTGVVEVISEWCGTAPSFDDAWDSAFGRAELGLSGLVDPLDVAVRIALRITERGHGGAWRARIPPTTVRLQHLLLTGVEEITASGGAGMRHVAALCGGEIVNCWRDDTSGMWNSSNAQRVCTFGIGRAVSLLNAAAAPHELDESASVDELRCLGDIDDDIVALFQNGVALLESVGHAHWVQSVLRGVLVTAKVKNVRMTSGSTNSRPGIVQVSYPATIVDIAETLLHESAHQYLNLVKRYGAFDDGSDEKLYWSPAAREYRPLTRIMIAYHAFGNVLLLYEALRTADIDDDGYVEKNMSAMQSKLAELDRPLRDNPALTDLGRAIYQPLADALQSRVSS